MRSVCLRALFAPFHGAARVGRGPRARVLPLLQPTASRHLRGRALVRCFRRWGLRGGQRGREKGDHGPSGHRNRGPGR